MFRELLRSEFAPYGALSETQLDALENHYNLLMRWNERINLTRIRELKDVVQLHFCESLFLAKSLPEGPLRIVDVGSGAGFPGIPVALFRPDCSVDLSESHQRKSVFLSEVCRGMANVRVLGQRAESLEPQYDWVISRAVRPSEILRLKIAHSGALLVGEADSAAIGNGLASPVPWGIGRYLVQFHVER